MDSASDVSVSRVFGSGLESDPWAGAVAKTASMRTKVRCFCDTAAPSEQMSYRAYSAGALLFNGTAWCPATANE